MSMDTAVQPCEDRKVTGLVATGAQSMQCSDDMVIDNGVIDGSLIAVGSSVELQPVEAGRRARSQSSEWAMLLTRTHPRLAHRGRLREIGGG